jgi:hypothetical protein
LYPRIAEPPSEAGGSHYTITNSRVPIISVGAVGELGMLAQMNEIGTLQEERVPETVYYN